MMYLVGWTQHHNKWVEASSAEEARKLVSDDTHRAPFGIVCSAAPHDLEILSVSEETED